MSTERRPIVAGVGELADDDASLRAALELGRRSGATVHLVHGIEVPPLMGAEAGPDLGYAEEWARLGPELTDALEELVRPLRGEARVVCHALPGAPGAVIRLLAAETGAGLVVVGATRAGPVRQALLGSTAQHVIRTMRVPVLVVRRPLSPAPPRVLLAVDLSPMSAVVHERGLDTVEAFLGPELDDARALVVASFGFVSPPIAAARLAEAAQEELRTFLAARRPRPGHVEPVVRLDGAPGAAIVAEAAEWRADLLVVGTHARHGIDHMLMGSTAEACIRDAPCNVLVIAPAEVPAHAVPAHLPASAAAAAAPG